MPHTTEYVEGIQITYRPAFRLRILAEMAFVGASDYVFLRTNAKDSSGFATAFATFVTVSFIATWAWRLFGADIIRVDGHRLQYRRELAGIGYSRTYAADEIYSLGWQQEVKEGRTRVPSRMEFDYRGKRIGIMWHIAEDESEQIISELLGIYPAMVRRWTANSSTTGAFTFLKI